MTRKILKNTQKLLSEAYPFETLWRMNQKTVGQSNIFLFERAIINIFCLKDTHREKSPSYKIPVPTKIINMVVGSSNQIFKKIK